jgi:hypothetical protein
MTSTPGKGIKAPFLEIALLHLIHRVKPVRLLAPVSICNKQPGETARIYYQMDVLDVITCKIIDAMPTLAIVIRHVEVCH